MPESRLLTRSGESRFAMIASSHDEPGKNLAGLYTLVASCEKNASTRSPT